jgi:hypothetical protein
MAAQVGLHKGNLVVVKRIYKRHVDHKRNILKELNTVRRKKQFFKKLAVRQSHSPNKKARSYLPTCTSTEDT